MAKKPFNPFNEFGEFISSFVDGSIFDVPKATETATEKVTTENVERMGNDRATEGKQRDGSTFIDSATKKKGASVNRGNGGSGGNDGNGVPPAKGNESTDTEKPETE